jgi:chromosome segregation ATPase
MVQTSFVELKEKRKRKQKKIIVKQYVFLNAGLKRIKDQLSYMTADNFMTHCSLYLWNKNMKIIDKFNS